MKKSLKVFLVVIMMTFGIFINNNIYANSYSITDSNKSRLDRVLGKIDDESKKQSFLILLSNLKTKYKDSESVIKMIGYLENNLDKKTFSTKNSTSVNSTSTSSSMIKNSVSTNSTSTNSSVVNQQNTNNVNKEPVCGDIANTVVSSIPTTNLCKVGNVLLDWRNGAQLVGGVQDYTNSYRWICAVNMDGSDINKPPFINQMQRPCYVTKKSSSENTNNTITTNTTTTTNTANTISVGGKDFEIKGYDPNFNVGLDYDNMEIKLKSLNITFKLKSYVENTERTISNKSTMQEYNDFCKSKGNGYRLPKTYELKSLYDNYILINRNLSADEQNFYRLGYMYIPKYLNLTDLNKILKMIPSFSGAPNSNIIPHYGQIFYYSNFGKIEGVLVRGQIALNDDGKYNYVSLSEYVATPASPNIDSSIASIDYISPLCVYEGK